MLLISAITAPSLLNQDDQNFLWAIFTDPELPPAIRSKLNELLEPFAGRAAVYDDRPYNSPTLLALAKEKGAIGTNGHLFTARIDDDDAWSRKTVGMARSQVNRWSGFSDPAAIGLGFTFECGLEWIMYDMVDVDILQRTGRRVTRPATLRPYRFPFLGTSVFVFSGQARPMSAVSAGHARMGKVLAEHDHEVEVIDTAAPMWLYCRHKQAESALQKARAPAIGMSLEQLAATFGLDADLTAKYLAKGTAVPYVLVKRIKRRRGELLFRMKHLQRKMDDPSLAVADRRQLGHEHEEVVDELEEVSKDLLGLPDEPPAGSGEQ